MRSEWICPLLKVLDALEALSIRYTIRGSLASALHGIIHSTLDLDLLAEVRPEHIPSLAEKLEPEFYMESEITRNEIAQQSALTLVHRLSILKIKIYISADQAFDTAQLNRSIEKVIDSAPERRAWVVSAEDLILARLGSYEAAKRTSETAWREALGIVKVQSDNLDWSYLTKTALLLGLYSILEVARMKTITNETVILD